MDAKYLVVFVTAPSPENAEEIARALVEAQLAACVNLLPEVRSIYTWEGEVCTETEVLMVIATDGIPIDKLALHPVPEIEAVAAEHKAELDAQKKASEDEIRAIREQTQAEIAAQIRSRLLALASQKRS